MSGGATLLIPGGGSSQIAMVRRARSWGFRVVVADRDTTCAAAPFADAVVAASSFDADAVEQAARLEGADALLVVGTDQPVLTAAIVSQRLGLPYPLTVDQARAVTNKAIMKERFAEAGIPSARWTLLGAEPASWDEQGLGSLRFPLVAKPVDSQGQRGIARVADRDGLARHQPELARHTRANHMLVEEFYPSHEVTVSGWADSDGTVDIWAVTDRVTLPSETSLGVCVAHRFPSLHLADTSGALVHDRRVVELTRRIVDTFELRDAPLYFQMLVGEQGVLVNEIAVRLGGAYEDQSLPPIAGVQPLDHQLAAIVRTLPETAARLLRQPGLPDGVEVARYAAVPLLFCNPGTIADVRGVDDLRSRSGVTDLQVLQTPGTSIRPMTNSGQRAAYAVLHADEPDDVDALVDAVFDTLRFEDAAGEQLLIDCRDLVKRSSWPDTEAKPHRAT